MSVVVATCLLAVGAVAVPAGGAQARLAEVEASNPTEADIPSPTEGTVLSDFVAESQMKSDLLQMLANFATYLKNDFQNVRPLTARASSAAASRARTRWRTTSAACVPMPTSR